MKQFPTGNPEAHDYLEGIEPKKQSPLEQVRSRDLESHYEEMMRNVSSDIRGAIETANYTPEDAFALDRYEVYRELCRRGLRYWNVRV